VWETDGDGTCRPVPGSLLSHCRENNIPLGLLSLLLPPWEVLCLSKGTQRPLQGSSNFPDLAQLEWAVATHCRGGRGGDPVQPPPPSTAGGMASMASLDHQEPAVTTGV
jgi:hypothetical protein